MAYINFVVRKNMIHESTENGLNKEVFLEIQKSNFVIIGCGGVGAFFAEMLVRTGAMNLVLIDGDHVENKNLNRTPFIKKDVEKFKVKALESRLKSINDKITIETYAQHLAFENKCDDIKITIRNKVIFSDIAIIAVDNKKIRIECEKICKKEQVNYLVIGIAINQFKLDDRWACGWNTTTPINEKEEEGYGENNGSYMSICMEAVSAGFNLMLSNIYKEINNETTDKNNKFIEKIYKNYQVTSQKL